MSIRINIYALEFKSCSTPNISFIKNLEYWHSLTKSKAENSFVLFGGNKIFKNKNADFIPWFKLNEIWK